MLLENSLGKHVQYREDFTRRMFTIELTIPGDGGSRRSSFINKTFATTPKKILTPESLNYVSLFGEC